MLKPNVLRHFCNLLPKVFALSKLWVEGERQTMRSVTRRLTLQNFCVLEYLAAIVMEARLNLVNVWETIYAGKETYSEAAGISGMVQAALLIEKKTFDEMVRFVMKAMKEGVPEDEIWATLEVMSSKELQADIVEGLKEIREGKVMRFRSAKEALEWLKS